MLYAVIKQKSVKIDLAGFRNSCSGEVVWPGVTCFCRNGTWIQSSPYQFWTD